MNIPYASECKVLFGMTFHAAIAPRSSNTYKPTTIDWISRSWNILSKPLFNTSYTTCTDDPLKQLWYTAQILPITGEATRQISNTISWYIWEGAIFRIPLSALFRASSWWGLKHLHIHSKCDALLLGRSMAHTYSTAPHWQQIGAVCGDRPLPLLTRLT